MSESPHTHWTDDEDLVGRYVLNRVEGEVQARLSSHLEECDLCRSRVAAERALAAGVRRTGRDELKLRLRERLAGSDGRSRASTAPGAAHHTVHGHRSRTRSGVWMYRTSLAASLLIVAGLGVYNRWFFPAEDEVPTATERPVEAPSDAALREDVPTERPEASTSESAGSGTAGPQIQGELGRPERRSPPSRILIPRAEERSRIGQEWEAKDEPSALLMFEGPSTPAMQSTAAGEWVEGWVTDIRETAAAKSVMGEAARSIKEVEPDAGMADRVESQKPSMVHVRQKPGSEIPAEFKRRRPAIVENTITARVERSETAMVITLYPDSLFAPEDLARATARPVTNDSVVVRIQDKLIRFKIPGGILAPVE